MLRPSAVAVLCSALVMVACGGDDQPALTTTTAVEGQATTTTTPGPVTTTTTGRAEGGIDPLEGASTASKSAAATSRETALLSDLRVARQEGYDRLVLEFRNTVPGYQVGFVDRPVTADGSGDEVKVGGAQVVQVRMEPALDADLTKESAPRTYTGPARISPGTPQIVEVVRTGGFEGVLTWVVGLRDRVAFRVQTLAGPPRLVVDFANH